MNHFPQAWGRPRDDIYGAYNPSFLPQSRGGYAQQPGAPITHTQSPVVTGTSVLGIKFKDGVVLAADNLASYGSLARFTDVHRLKLFNRKAVVGFGGDVSDMQYIDRLLNSLDVEENYGGSGGAKGDEESKSIMSAKNLHKYLSKVMYKRRSDFNPLWNALLVAGLDEDEKPFLAFADLLGTTYSSPTLATGFGAHLAQPILRRKVKDEQASQVLTKEEAVDAIRECMKVLFYRDARSMNEYSIAVIDKSGVDLKEDVKLENQSWDFADKIRGYGTQTA
ncbi:Proteasome subunit beta type-7 [Teratosphaeria destructans]|uniref:Proteasome subunit beta n=1 Tax=Teratosphaeria destructans TaxID=418781 RepID=A0A9W7W058_9PEZI|nr:Proteasome subunit beta type-7 [Teratosphaeria destructans]